MANRRTLTTLPKIEQPGLIFALREWWAKLQPDWRGDHFPFERSETCFKDWGGLCVGSRNGVFVVVLALSWAKWAIQGELHGELDEMIDDVYWTLYMMASYLNARRVDRSPTADEPEADEEDIEDVEEVDDVADKMEVDGGVDEDEENECFRGSKVEQRSGIQRRHSNEDISEMDTYGEEDEDERGSSKRRRLTHDQPSRIQPPRSQATRSQPPRSQASRGQRKPTSSQRASTSNAQGRGKSRGSTARSASSSTKRCVVIMFLHADLTIKTSNQQYSLTTSAAQSSTSPFLIETSRTSSRTPPGSGVGIDISKNTIMNATSVRHYTDRSNHLVLLLHGLRFITAYDCLL